MNPIGIVIHHTAGNEQTAQALRNVFKSRFNVNYIGYHYVISRTGEVWKDLRDDQVGIHNNVGRLNNHNSLGVCLVGNFENIQPTDAQMNKAKEIIATLKQRHNITEANIVGHRDMKATVCPGRNLYARLDELRKSGQTSSVMELTREQKLAGYQALAGRTPSEQELSVRRHHPEFYLGFKGEIDARINQARQAGLADGRNEKQAEIANLNAELTSHRKQLSEKAEALTIAKEEVRNLFGDLEKCQMREPEVIIEEKIIKVPAEELSAWEHIILGINKLLRRNNGSN